jgi:hypothetical protein
MPTYSQTSAFRKNYRKLSSGQRKAFQKAVASFVQDLQTGRFRPGLRVKGVVGITGVFEMTWAPNGRAMFTYGDEVRGGEAHIVWLAVGAHDILPGR